MYTNIVNVWMYLFAVFVIWVKRQCKKKRQSIVQPSLFWEGRTPLAGLTHTVECVNRWHPLTVKAGSTLLLPSFSVLPCLPPVNLRPLCNPFTPLCGDTAEPSILSSYPARFPPFPLPASSYANTVIMLHFTESFFLCLLAPWARKSFFRVRLCKKNRHSLS